MEQWKDNVALVTGASTGIGAAICRELVKQGMIVLGCATRIDRIQAIASELKASGAEGILHPYMCDLQNEDDIATMFINIRKEFGKLDVCINNAGMASDASLISGDSAAWRAMLNVNIMGLCICTKESIKLMQENKRDGLIIHVGCIMGHKVPDLQYLQGIPNLGFYYGTKFMVRGLAESLRHELKRAESKIRVAAVSPGAVHTEFYERAFNKEAADKFYSENQCLEPQDVADAVLHVMEVPPHVNVQDIVVQPLGYTM